MNYLELLNSIRRSLSHDSVCDLERECVQAYNQDRLSKGEYNDLIDECRCMKRTFPSCSCSTDSD